MRESHTAILERHAELNRPHRTEPYECAWATEATFYVYSWSPGPALDLHVECSAEGMRWLDHGTRGTLEPGHTAARVPVRHFDGWLQLRIEGANSDTRYDIYLCLKE